MPSTPKRSDDDLDKFHEECALFGIYGTCRCRRPHRARPACPAASRPGSLRHRHLRRPPFPQSPRRRAWSATSSATQSVIAKLKGYCAIGHNRYATTGGSSDRNIQPIFADFDFGGLALAHNGNLTNAYLLRKELVRMGCLFQSTTDTEVINHLIARSQLLDASSTG